eukprot:TRINITY_DN231_c0_g1_i1.p1 TRINITY_DN231_c0_g1~~TRINITY_DN231_c0_g1_i1.p1  ORF type:complete len:166 (+),score=36.51 TRINITY_DN231_c0_g1_i1:101-598(+)
MLSSIRGFRNISVPKASGALLSRNFSAQKLYTASSTASGGRDGKVKSDDGLLDLSLSVPKSMGGKGDASKTNPEQLFSAGYAACFQGAMGVAVQQLGVKYPMESSKVTANVSIWKDDGFKLSVELRGSNSQSDKATTQKVMEKAHTICPYSKATKGNIDVKLVAE